MISTAIAAGDHASESFDSTASESTQCHWLIEELASRPGYR